MTFNCRCLSRWKLPDIPGVKDFKGKLMHTGDWDTQGSAWWQESVKGWESKTVGVIGSVSFIPDQYQ